VARHIGIIAVSPEGSAMCYRTLAQRVSSVEDPEQRPLITLHSIAFSRYLRAIDENDWEMVAQLLHWSSETLSAAGAHFCILPDNLAHHAAPMARAGSPLPWLSMIDLVADAVVRDGRKTVGLIGAKALTAGSIYQTVLGLRGVKVMVPETDDLQAINDIIFRELIHGSVTQPSRERLHQILGALAERGCEGVILGSTETPLLVSGETSDLSLYDPVQLLVEGAIEAALGRREI
jgi:aspartate racemase